MSANGPPPTICAFPRPILIDEREKHPYSFTGFADVRNRRLLVVETRTKQLFTGDYSLYDLTTHVAIERKSLADLYGTIARRRAEFDNELSRLQTLVGLATVVIEADWNEVLNRPPPDARLPPVAVLNAVLRWQVLYPRVSWWFVPGRRLGETVTLRLLERFAERWERCSRGQPGTDADLLGSQ